MLSEMGMIVVGSTIAAGGISQALSAEPAPTDDVEATKAQTGRATAPYRVL